MHYPIIDNKNINIIWRLDIFSKELVKPMVNIR